MNSADFSLVDEYIYTSQWQFSNFNHDITIQIVWEWNGFTADPCLVSTLTFTQ